MLIEALSQRARVPIEALHALANSASRRYKVYPIDKANGQKREICQPSRTLKAVQRFIVRTVILQAPIHDLATAYKKGASIKDNATRHAGSRYTLRLDFRDFFPSFTSQSVEMFFRNMSDTIDVGLSEEDIGFCVKIVTRHGRLAVGAPSSPALTNAMMYQFDNDVCHFALQHGLIYTRYADDLYISSFEPDQLTGACEFIAQRVRDHRNPELALNKEKTLNLSMRGFRAVTGLVLTPEGKVSIGRKRKREIRSLVYRKLTSKLKLEEFGKLTGLLAFAYDVEPDFVASLSKKFNTDVSQIFRNR